MWVWRGYGDRHGYGYGVGMGIPMGMGMAWVWGSPWVWVWRGYRDPHGCGYGVGMRTEIPPTRQLLYIARETAAEQLNELVQTRLNGAINTITHTTCQNSCAG